jgi:hypothetical protein
VVLVDAEPVMSDRLGEFELVEIGVVHLVPADRTVKLTRNVDPFRPVRLAEILR